MNKKSLYAFVFAVLLMTYSTSASAITMDVSWTEPEGVNFTYNSVNFNDVWATEFDITLNGGGWNSFDTIGYCVDIDGDLYQQTYNPVFLDPIPRSDFNYLHAAWLMDKWADDASGNKEKEAGLQLAIWNAVYGSELTASFTNKTTGTIDDHFSFYYQEAPSDDFMRAALGYKYQIVTFTAGNTSYSDTKYQEVLIRTNPVPEPATMVLFGIGLLGLGALCRKKRI